MKRNGTLKIKNAAGCWEEIGFSGTLYRDGDYLFSRAFEREDNDEESWKCPENEEGVTWAIV